MIQMIRAMPELRVGGTKPVIIIVIAAIVVLSARRASSAQPPSPSHDWLARFMAEAPPQYENLEERVGQWNIRYKVTYFYYPGDGTRKVTREFTNGVDAIFDRALGGVRVKSYVVSGSKGPATRSGATVQGRNPEYTFMVDSQGGHPFVISGYDEVPQQQDKRKLWADQLEYYRGLTAADFDGESLLRLIQSGEVRVLSAKRIDMDGRRCVRFDTERRFDWKPESKKYQGSVTVDPSFHWAVRSYEQHFVTGGMRTATIDYNPQVTSLAYPLRIIQDDLGPHGEPVTRMVMKFEHPQPSHATAKDFTLASFGLERPGQVARRAGHSTAVFVLVNAVVAIALVLCLIAIYRYRRSKGVRFDGTKDG